MGHIYDICVWFPLKMNFNATKTFSEYIKLNNIVPLAKNEQTVNK